MFITLGLACIFFLGVFYFFPLIIITIILFLIILSCGIYSLWWGLTIYLDSKYHCYWLICPSIELLLNSDFNLIRNNLDTLTGFMIDFFNQKKDDILDSYQFIKYLNSQGIHIKNNIKTRYWMDEIAICLDLDKKK